MVTMILVLAALLITLLVVIAINFTVGLMVGAGMVPVLIMALILLRRRQPERLRAAPRGTVGYRHRARARFARGDLAGALEDYNRTINGEISDTPMRGAIEKFRAALFTERGQVYFAQQQYERALEDFQSACELHRNFHPMLAWMGIVHYELRNLEEARIWWAAALEKYPDYTKLNGLNWVNEQMGWLNPPIVKAQALAALLNARP